ncbi:Hypothetical predicted protein [Olea europaea subsp. europaea]|uniref:Uncharacterized protein n=1 Tax=Olea europaea subsp. europaea TaxID=158383 RepID=A0A8S0UVX2_OLEEU|nr:Hypothetical predicted protein [Olea europaea subsp. europaea]
MAIITALRGICSDVGVASHCATTLTRSKEVVTMALWSLETAAARVMERIERQERGRERENEGWSEMNLNFRVIVISDI